MSAIASIVVGSRTVDRSSTGDECLRFYEDLRDVSQCLCTENFI